MPGITIGDNTVIGAGSIVTKDIPANVVAVGNPCRVMREINEHDKGSCRYYSICDKQKFIEEVYYEKINHCSGNIGIVFYIISLRK